MGLSKNPCNISENMRSGDHSRIAVIGSLADTLSASVVLDFLAVWPSIPCSHDLGQGNPMHLNA